MREGWAGWAFISITIPESMAIVVIIFVVATSIAIAIVSVTIVIFVALIVGNFVVITDKILA